MVVAVIDDEKPAREELSAIVHDYDASIEVCMYETAEKALERMAEENIDLAFVDINMPDMDGVTLAKLLRKLKQDIGIIFATAYNNYAKEAFEVEAFGYILKPYDENKIMRLLDKFRMQAQQIDRDQELSARMSMKLPLNIQKKTILLDIRDIVYAEIENRNCIIHTVKGDFSCNYTMAMLEDKLKNYDFFRIQKSYLIHLKYLLEIYPWFNNTTGVKMKGFEDQVLTVGRSQVKELKKILNS